MKSFHNSRSQEDSKSIDSNHPDASREDELDDFDPVQALQSLSNPSTPEGSRINPKSRGKVGKSFFASAMEAIDEHEGITGGKTRKAKMPKIF